MIKYKLAYFGVLIISWLIMRFYLFRQTAVLFYMLLALFPVLFILFRLGARRTGVALCPDKQVIQRGEMICLRVSVQGKNRIPTGPVVVWLRHRNYMNGGWRKKKLVLSAGKGESCELYAETKYCSRFAFCVHKAKIYDVSGIFSMQIRLGEAARIREVTVLPPRFEIAEQPVRVNPNVMVEGGTYSDTRSGDDVSEIFDIRSYRPGDRFNRIHWKLTAKADRLMVKEFGFPVDGSVLIFLELGCYADASEFLRYRDALFSALYSLSERLTADGQVHYIAWNARAGANEKRKITCAEDFYETLGLLLYEPAGGREENRAALYCAEYQADQYTNIFYLSASRCPQEGVLSMVELRKSAWLSILLLDGHEAVRAIQCALPLEVDVVYLNPESLAEEFGSAFGKEGSY